MSTRVLEFGGLAAGFCGRLFRHGGAEVIRIEGVVPSVTDAWVSQGAVDAFLHAGKQRVAFRGRDQLLELAGSVDVVVAEGMPEELEALGWDAIDSIRVAITPFGMTGPRRQWHASASVLLAMGGYTYLMGDPGRAPLTLPGHYTEFQSGQYAYIGTSACLYEGQDHSLDVSMLEVVLSLSQMTTVMWSCNGDVRSRHGSSFGILYPINLFPCADGWFHVNVVPHFWGPFTQMLGRPDLEDDVRFASSRGRIDNKDELDRIIFESLGHRTKAEVQKLGEQARVPTGVLQEIDEVLADPHLAERNVWCDINGMQSPSLAYRFDGDLPNDFIVEPIDG